LLSCSRIACTSQQCLHEDPRRAGCVASPSMRRSNPARDAERSKGTGGIEASWRV
jgi:hypothetical protein